MSQFHEVLWVAAWLLTAIPAFAEGPKVTVGSKSYTESVILGELTAHVLRSSGATAIHRSELGGTQVLWKAPAGGRNRRLPRIHRHHHGRDYAGYASAGRRGHRQGSARYHVHMSRRLGFNDTYALGMKEELAERLNIKTISDLKSHPELMFGVSDEFLERPDGLPGLRDRYGLNPRGVRSMDHNMALRGLDRGSIQVTDLFSTDAEIQYYHMRVLEDDLGFFPFYYAVLLSRDDLAERAPAAAKSLHILEGLISNDEMVEMNARVKMDRISETLRGRRVPQPQGGHGDPDTAGHGLGSLERPLLQVPPEYARAFVLGGDLPDGGRADRHTVGDMGVQVARGWASTFWAALASFRRCRRWPCWSF